MMTDRFQTAYPAGRLPAAMALTLLAAAAQAAEGLQTPAADALWPHWQTRISLQAGAPSPLAISGWVENAQAQRGVQAARLLGDYYFSPPTSGGFRASGGLLLGTPAGVAMAGSPTWGTRWGWGLNPSGGPLSTAAGDGLAASTYLGLGYSGAATGSGLSLTADLGLIAERPGVAFSAARALFGNSGAEFSLRDLRLSPLMQLGLRYTF